MKLIQRSDIVNTIINGLVENGHLDKASDAVIVTNGFDSKNDKGFLRILNTKLNKIFSFQYLTPYFQGTQTLVVEDYIENMEEGEKPPAKTNDVFFKIIESKIKNKQSIVELTKLIGVGDELTNFDLQQGVFSGYIDEFYRYGAQVGPYKINAYNESNNVELFKDDDFWIRMYESTPDSPCICDVTSIQGVHLSPKIGWTNEVITKFMDFYMDETPVAEFIVPAEDDDFNIKYVISK